MAVIGVINGEKRILAEQNRTISHNHEPNSTEGQVDYNDLMNAPPNMWGTGIFTPEQLAIILSVFRQGEITAGGRSAQTGTSGTWPLSDDGLQGLPETPGIAGSDHNPTGNDFSGDAMLYRSGHTVYVNFNRQKRRGVARIQNANWGTIPLGFRPVQNVAAPCRIMGTNFGSQTFIHTTGRITITPEGIISYSNLSGQVPSNWALVNFSAQYICNDPIPV